MTLVYLSGNRIQGLSSDTKPSNVTANAVFFETNTFKSFDYSSGSWTERTVAGGEAVSSLLMAHSTTIGDYTVPPSATSSSVGFDSTVLSNDLGSASGTINNVSWNPNGTCGGSAGNSLTSSHATVDNLAWSKDSSMAGNWGWFGLNLSANGQGCLINSGGMGVQSGNTGALTGFSTLTPHYRGYGTCTYTISASYTYRNSLPIANVHDGSTSTVYATDEETNPYCVGDMGSSTNCDAIAIYSNSDINETELVIQVSTNNSDWTTVRTVLVSSLSHGNYNYIRFNPVVARYIKIKGSSGLSKKLVLNQIKILNAVSSDNIGLLHGHGTISGTDTTLGLDGT